MGYVARPETLLTPEYGCRQNVKHFLLRRTLKFVNDRFLRINRYYEILDRSAIECKNKEHEKQLGS